MNKLELVPVVSSQIAARGYDEATHTMRILFQPHKNGAPGPLYEYPNFPPEDWQAWIEAESVGSHFIKHIKPHPAKFPYRKIEQLAKVR